jgi:hypothetical protein
VFYTGFLAGVSWLAIMTMRRRPLVSSLRDAIPQGYELAVVGLGLFALGGVGDGIWHSVFGIETGIDALLSPTHLVLLVGMLGGATAPARAAWRDDTGRRPTGLASFLPALLSITVTTTGVAFFHLYVNGFNNWPMQFSYTPNEDDILAALGVVATLVSTAILVGASLLLLRRWDPPVGSFTIMFGVVGVFMAGLDAYEHSWQVVAPLVAGMAGDAVVALVRHRQAMAFAVIVPLVMWSVSTLTTHLAWTVEWPPELWMGQIIMAALLGLALSLLADPPGPGPRRLSVAETAGEADAYGGPEALFDPGVDRAKNPV